MTVNDKSGGRKKVKSFLLDQNLAGLAELLISTTSGVFSFTASIETELVLEISEI